MGKYLDMLKGQKKPEKWYKQKDIYSGCVFTDSYWHNECELLAITETEPEWVIQGRKDVDVARRED